MSNSLLKYINNNDIGTMIDNILDLDINEYLKGSHVSYTKERNTTFCNIANYTSTQSTQSTQPSIILGSLQKGLFNPLTVSSQLNKSSRYFSTNYFREVDARREAEENIKYRAIYFDPTASDDTGDGSIIKPYKNLTAARIKPGFRHLIKAGTTTTCTEDGIGTKRYLLIPNTATSQAPIIIGRYGSGENPKFNGAGVSQVFRIGTDGKYIRIRDIEIDTVGADDTNSDKFGISYNTSNADTMKTVSTNIIIARCSVHDVKRDTSLSSDCDGIKLYGADNMILDCTIYNIATDGIWFHGYRMVIAGCTVYSPAIEYQLVQKTGGDCIQCGAKSDGSIVVGNYLDHSNAACKQCIYFEQTISISDSVIICDNICFMGKKGDSIEMGQSCITCGAPNSYVARNFCKGAGGGIVINDDIECCNNVILMDTARGIAAGNRNNIHHNTIVQISSETTQTWSVGISVDPGSKGTEIHSNLFIDMYNGIVSDVSTAFNEHHNAFKIKGVSLAYVRLSGVVTSPSWSDISTISASDYDLNYRPVVNSKLIGSAYSNPLFDMDMSLGGKLTIGAYSYN